VKILTIVLFGLTSFSAMAVDTVIKAVELKNDKAQESKLSIKVAGNLNENPQLNVGKNSLDIVIPGTKVNAKIVRHFGDAIVTATQEDRETVRVKVGLSYSLQGKESLANVTLKDGSKKHRVERCGEFLGYFKTYEEAMECSLAHDKQLEEQGIKPVSSQTQ
jgi:hypothetical protein